MLVKSDNSSYQPISASALLFVANTTGSCLTLKSNLQYDV